MQPAGEVLPQAPGEGGRYGEVFDRGYKHYDGPRLGRQHARRALVGYSVKRAMGIKKSWTAKVIPIFLYIAVLMPVIISLGIRAFLPTAEVLAYYDYFGFIFLVEGVFAAMIAPELLCSDRQEKVLPLYFARSISRADYLIAKLTAAALLMLTMSLAPAAILWLGRQLLDDRPLRAMSDHIGDLGRLAVAGVLVVVLSRVAGVDGGFIHQPQADFDCRHDRLPPDIDLAGDRPGRRDRQRMGPVPHLSQPDRARSTG